MKSKIFYLDDEQELCELFKELFESEALEIKIFTHAKDLFKELELSPPSACFLDFNMPEMTGIEAAKKISKDIPKYLITGNEYQNEKSLFVKVIAKPFDINEIHNIIDGLVN